MKHINVIGNIFVMPVIENSTRMMHKIISNSDLAMLSSKP